MCVCVCVRVCAMQMSFYLRRLNSPQFIGMHDELGSIDHIGSTKPGLNCHPMPVFQGLDLQYTKVYKGARFLNSKLAT